jgi:monoamine oxidase
MTMSRRSVVAGGSAALIAGAAPRVAWGQTQADVIVIGAGLAGLNAAALLEAGGATVIVVEGEQRIGGRLYTFDDLPGRPEAGAIQIGTGYRRLEEIAARTGVALVPNSPDSRDTLYRVNGMTVAGKDWATSPANRLPPEDHAITPAALGPHYWSKLVMLAKPEDWLDADMATHDVPYAKALADVGAGAEALRLIAANLNGNSLNTLSMLHVVRALAIYRAGSGPTRLIAGGSQRLPEAMAKPLKGPVRLGAKVRAFGADAHGASVTLANGQRIAAKHVVCTIPFAAMRTMVFDGGFSPAMGALIATLPYTQASFAYLAATDPFWRHDGLPETLWTDGGVLGRVFVLGDDPPMLKVWVTGGHDADVARMTEAARARTIISAIEAARPSATGKLKLLRRFSWNDQPGARGLYHHIGVGQGALLAAAVRAEGARVHFAGEHLARGASGIEGALESGERVAQTILKRL